MAFGSRGLSKLENTASTPESHQSFCPLAAWPASKKIFGYFPSRQNLNEPKSLYQSPSGAPGPDEEE
jgi:hypothetical protein